VIKSRRVRWEEHVARKGKIRNLYKPMVRKPKGKRPCRRPGHRWDDNIKIDLKKVGWEGMDWIHLPQDSDQWRVLRNTVMNFKFHNLWKYLD
jgi:hypothetical protein